MKYFLGFLLFTVSVACAVQGIMDLINERYELAVIFLGVAALTFFSSDCLSKR